MKIKSIFFTLLIALLLLVVAFEARAGFGISPPRVWNERLAPGSHYEQVITLTRSDPDNPVEIVIEVDAPEIKDWVRIDKGNKFIYPAGEQQFPMTVIVDVPEDAGYSTYYGKMTVKAVPTDSKGQVTVALGAVIDFKLRVSGEKFSDFKIKGISIPDMEEGWPLKLVVSLKNIGNVKTRPSKVHLDIFDNYHSTKLFSGDITQMSWVDSFKDGKSEGELMADLKPGQYWADYEVYKGEETVTGKIRFNVLLAGELTPKSVTEKISETIKNFFSGSPLRLIIVTFVGTLILVLITIGVIFRVRRRKN